MVDFEKLKGVMVLGKKKKKNQIVIRVDDNTYVVDLDQDGKPDVIRVYKRKKGKNSTQVANVKFGTTEMKRKNKKKK